MQHVWVELEGKRTAREIISRLLQSTNARRELHVATENGALHRVLEAARIMQIEIQLAVFAVFGDSNTGADGCNIVVEDEGETSAMLVKVSFTFPSKINARLTITRDITADGSLRAPCPSISKRGDVDLGWIRECSFSNRAGDD